MLRRQLLAIALCCAATARADHFPSSGLPASNPAFVGWANGFSNLNRSPATFGAGNAALGVPNSGVVSLGDGGSITLTFAAPLYNGPGADFAVFENGFRLDPAWGFGSGVFAELAFVEVSSNGTDFFRFAGISETQTTNQVGLGIFSGIDPTDIHNLAGQFPALEGTPFNLQDLAGTPGLNINAITHVRIVDIVGALDPQFQTLDSEGNPINDPWPTNFATAGFDLDAVGVIHQTPEPASAVLLGIGALGLALHGRRRGVRS